MMSSLWDKPAMVKTAKLSWLVQFTRSCHKKSALSTSEETKSTT
jgi:hypothetical protein